MIYGLGDTKHLALLVMRCRRTLKIMGGGVNIIIFCGRFLPVSLQITILLNMSGPTINPNQFGNLAKIRAKNLKIVGFKFEGK